MKKYILIFFVSAVFLMLLIASGIWANDQESQTVITTPAKTTPLAQVTPTQLAEPAPVQTAKDSRAGEQINWQVISSGGSNNSTSPNFTLSSTAGQTATGSASSDNFGMDHGFWQIFGRSCCKIGGDADDNGGVNVGDAVFMINYVFKSGPAPNCADEGDANNDCALNVGDAVHLINYVFKSGPAPVCGCVD